MLLRIPEDAEDVLWEGPLEAATDEAEEQLTRDLRAADLEADAHDAISSLPVVSIGRPVVWTIQQVFQPGDVPATVGTMLEEGRFYLVRLSCSFRPRRDDIQFEWARFVVRLQPDEAGRQPIAFDLHPHSVIQEIKHDVKVAFSPTLRFQELEAGAGAIETGLEYKELRPLVSAAGFGEPEASWDYEPGKGIPLQGGRFMHLLAEAPIEASSGTAVLDLVADVRVARFRIPVLSFRRKELAEKNLTVKLW